MCPPDYNQAYWSEIRQRELIPIKVPPNFCLNLELTCGFHCNNWLSLEVIVSAIAILRASFKGNYNNKCHIYFRSNWHLKWIWMIFKTVFLFIACWKSKIKHRNKIVFVKKFYRTLIRLIVTNGGLLCIWHNFKFQLHYIYRKLYEYFIRIFAVFIFSLYL